MKNFINHIRQFVNFTDDEAAAFYNAMTEVHFKKGALLLEQGSICEDVYFITKGTVIYFMQMDDREIINEVFFENCWVTEYGSFLAKSPALKSMRAMYDVTALALSYSNMQQLYSKAPCYERFGRLMAENLFVTHERAMIHMRKSAEERYLMFAKQRPELLQRIPQYMIASMLNITPEALSRIRKRAIKPVKQGR